MLDKLKLIAAFEVAIQLLRVFFPALDLGEGFEGAALGLINSLYVLVPVVIGWFAKESAAEVARLVTR